MGNETFYGMALVMSISLFLRRHAITARDKP